MQAMSSARAREDRRASELRCGGAQAVLPLDRRSPKGRLRWYLVEAPADRECSTCEELRRLLPADVLEDAFVPCVERWTKRGSTWAAKVAPLYGSYFLAGTRDVAALNKALRHLTLPLRLVGSQGRFFSPVADDALAWLASVMDAGHVVRRSVARIENGVLRVTAGPLVGQEERVVKIDRHRRVCWVHVGEGPGGFTTALPLEVPFKS